MQCECNSLSMATFSSQFLFLLHREARPEGHSLIFSLKDTPLRQMLTSTTRVFKQPSKNWRTVFSVYYPTAHEAHVSHTGCTSYNHCTWYHMQVFGVFLPDSQWAVTANYQSAAYLLKVGCLGLAFPGKVWMSICEKNSGRSGGASWLTPFQILGLEQRREGRVEVGRGDTVNGRESGLQREVTKTVNSPGTWFTAVCHSAVPTTAILFPSGLNLSKGIVCVSGLPLTTKDSLVVRESEGASEREREGPEQQRWNCSNANTSLLKTE